MTYYMYIFFLLQKARDELFCSLCLYKSFYSLLFIFILGHGNDTLKVMGYTAQHYSVCNSKGFSEFHFYGYHLLLPSKSLCQRNGKYQVLYKCHPLIYRHLQQNHTP